MSEVALAEPEAVQAEAPAETQEEAPSTQENAANPIADAGPAATPEADVDAAFEAYRQEQKGSEPEQPEPRAAEPQVDPEVLRQAEEGRTRYTNSHKAAHDAIDLAHGEAVERLVQEGYSKPIAEALIAPLTKTSHDKVNEHHAVGLKDAGFEAAYEQNAQFWRGVEAGVPREHHPTITQKLQDGKYGSYKDAVADIYALGVAEGEKKGYGKGEETGFKSGYRKGLTRAGEVESLSSDGARLNGNAGGQTFANADALFTAWNNKEISRDVYAREYKRLTGSEPD